MSARSEQRAYSRLETDEEVIARVGTSSVESDDSLRERICAALAKRITFLDVIPTPSPLQLSDIRLLRSVLRRMHKEHGVALDLTAASLGQSNVLVEPRKRWSLDLSNFERRLVWVD